MIHSVAKEIAVLSNEAELAHRASQGSGDAFSQLYVRYFDAIYRYVYYRTGHVAEAEDLTERVFLKAWEAMGRYEQRSCGFRAWLFRIARNLVTDHYRTRKETLALEDVPPSLEYESTTPEGILTRQEDVRRLQAAIARLSEEQQQVIILRFIEGISHAEVATIIGKSVGACRVVQHRALAALHEILKDED